MPAPHSRTAIDIKWSATRTPCGARSDNGHPCGRAAGHAPGNHVCVCRAERALESIGEHPVSEAS